MYKFSGLKFVEMYLMHSTIVRAKTLGHTAEMPSYIQRPMVCLVFPLLSRISI